MSHSPTFTVLKFGGSSVGTPERINGVIDIVLRSHSSQQTSEDGKHGAIAVAVSAFSGVTDQLIRSAKLASSGDKSYLAEFDDLKQRHIAAMDALIAGNSSEAANARTTTQRGVESMLQELQDILQGCFLIRELSKRTLDFVSSFGERLSAYIIAQTISSRAAQSGVTAEFLDARAVITTDDSFGAAKVDFETTNANIQRYFQQHKDLQIITGFIGSTHDGQTTTLGRGGSDYTAAIFGAALKAREIEIWTDVDGMMTADPRKAKNTQTLPKVTYEEAMELSHFGAKVIYPPTIQPALDMLIPISIKNTFNPSFAGTLIDKEGDTNSTLPVKGVSSIKEIALLRVEGTGMVGVVGVSQRVFGALARERVNVILITQASSEHSICLAVEPAQAQAAVKAIEAEFSYEINITRQVRPVVVEHDLSILAIVGANMRKTPGIAGKIFQALGRNGVNVRAIAQGSSELNISAVIAQKDEVKAINAIHNDFFLSKTKTLHLFIVGTGLIGKELLAKIRQQAEHLATTHAVELKVIALANSKKMVVSETGIDLGAWQDALAASETAVDLNEFAALTTAMNLPNKVFIDNTSSPDVARLYERVLQASVAVVTPNKKANTMETAYYRAMRSAALKANTKFLYETNVGAGLPLIGAIRDLVSSGDRIQRVQGVLSGTLSYVFNTFTAGKKFSDVIREAHTLGYTEPDPRDDLGGMDVARKILIIAREIGYTMELADVEVESLTPASCVHAASTEEFFTLLEAENGQYDALLAKATSAGKVLRYIATLADGKATVKLEMVDASHPFYRLGATDNIFAVVSDYYGNAPLVVQGPGAGAHVTAAGVLADILRISAV
jgi:bifunctional aspartokinase / homoserine dehydrogenase 1